MDEELLKLMVRILYRNPGEWFTFKRMANVLNISGIDESLVGAFVDFRNDLFATSQDRRFKLQSMAIEQIAQTGLGKWTVPQRPERKPRTTAGSYTPRPDGETAVHYCYSSDDAILADIQEQRIPEIALVTSCCWRRICQARGRNFALVPEETWEDVCRFRGYILGRENPRGF